MKDKFRVKVYNLITEEEGEQGLVIEQLKEAQKQFNDIVKTEHNDEIFNMLKMSDELNKLTRDMLELETAFRTSVDITGKLREIFNQEEMERVDEHQKYIDEKIEQIVRFSQFDNNHAKDLVLHIINENNEKEAEKKIEEVINHLKENASEIANFIDTYI